MRAVAAVPCGRRSKWAVLVLWLVLLAVAGPLAGKLQGAQKNDNATWLPATAESTQVLELQKAFRSSDALPVVVVYERDAGVTADDLATVGAHAKALGGVSGVVGEVVGPVPAKDGKALEVIAQIEVGKDGWEKIADVVTDVREIVDDSGPGLTAYVTGPAGLAADQAVAFEGIDGTLLYAALGVVIVMLLLTYRSPILWLLPVLSAGVALVSAQAVVYLLAHYGGLTVNAQSAGILTVLVFGAGTDYALLLVSRYREELRRHSDRHEAMAFALRRTAEPIIASAATVAVGMLCLVAADTNSTKGLGPVAAAGILVGLVAMLTLLPALLVTVGRWVFWPVVPRFGSAEPTTDGVWARVGRGVARRPRAVWIATTLVLGAFAFGLVELKADGVPAADQFVTKPRSVTGQEVLERHFAAGQGQPIVVIGAAGAAPGLREVLAGVSGIVDVTEPVVKDGHVLLQATLTDPPDGKAAEATIDRVREAVHRVPGGDAKVGGFTATNLDIQRAAQHDRELIIPLVLVVVTLILALLLRSIVAPLVLIATVVLSFATALGISALVFRHVLGFAGEDSSFPLFVFVFLVALGIDYNIFLMTRVREEAARTGTRRGALTALAVTGGVITSAGLVLAGTFAALATLPLVAFAELGFAVALGVILDTIVVRSVLVTALNLDIGRWMWWPSRLAARRDEADDADDAAPTDEAERELQPDPTR